MDVLINKGGITALNLILLESDAGPREVHTLEHPKQNRFPIA